LLGSSQYALSFSTIDFIGGSRRPSPAFRSAASSFGWIEYLRASLATDVGGALRHHQRLRVHDAGHWLSIIAV
jgi:hypothetical protein